MSTNPLQPFINLVPAPFRNRYILVLTFFFFWMIFIDKHDVITQWRLEKTKAKLERDKDYYTKKIKEAERQRKNLQENGERFAREKYYMKKKGEDVFIIEEKK
jgi:cell division protein FtsB